MSEGLLFAAAVWCREAAPVAFLILIRSTLALAAGMLFARATWDRRPAWSSPILRATLVCCAVVIALSPLPAGAIRSIWTLPPAEMEASQPVGDLPVRPAIAPMVPSSASPEAFKAVPGSPVQSSEPVVPSRPVVPISAWASLLAAMAWGAVSLWLLGRLLTCRRMLALLYRESPPVGGEPARILAEICHRLGIPRPGLCESSVVRSPFLAGLRRATIYLPVDPEPDESLLRAVLLHELAHLRRRDGAWGLACQVLRAAVPIQPLLWVLARQMERSSEQACDSEVVEAGYTAPTYADCLLRLSEKWAPSEPQLLLAAGVVSFRI